MPHRYSPRYAVLAAVLLALFATLWRAGSPAEPAATAKKKVLGLDKVVAFTYVKKGLDTRKLKSVTFVTAGTAEWKYWADRGVVSAVGKTWFDLLRNPVDKAVDILLGLNYGDNPKPVVAIDEFGFDFGGQTDAKSAEILRQTKRKRPGLGLAVWEMRGPVPKVLAEAYRDVCDLVLMECYVDGPKHYWWLAGQVQAARFHGILDKSVVALGLGKGGNPGEIWATTNEELERQIRFVRLMAPESPGIGFFAAGATEELMAKADELCGRLFDLPTDGTGLPAEALAVARLFRGPHAKGTLILSPQCRSAADPGKLVEPKVMRACVLNVGEADARDVTIRLRNPKDKGGDVFAQGKLAAIAKRSQAVAELPVSAKWNVWKTWDVEVDAPGCDVHVLRTDK